MAKFLNTSRASAEIDDIVGKAKNQLTLITPYLKITDRLLERLKFVDGRGIKTTIVCRRDDLKPEVKDDLKQLRNLELRFDENVHAKCFYNEESMVITSLNLYDHSQQFNKEMGILLSLRDDRDKEVFGEALNEAKFIVSTAEPYKPVKEALSSIVKGAISAIEEVAATYEASSKNGHCIHCRASIALDPSTPYCETCYRVWNKYKNQDYEEKYCHSCGKPGKTTKRYPRCTSCFKKSK